VGKLTSLEIKNKKPESKELRLSDGKGLFLRIRPSGAKSWLYCFRMPKSRALQQMTLGSSLDISLDEARDMLQELRKQIKEGLDPRQVREAKKTENTEAVTMQVLFEYWVTFLKDRNAITPKWIKAHEGRWKNHFKNLLGNILTRDISQQHLAKALDIMSGKGIKEETRKSLTMLNQILEYGKKRHHIKENSARALKPKDFSVSANRPRDRALSLPELNKLWSALDEATKKRNGIAKTSVMSIITATAIKLLILTGARRGEVCAIRWEEINLEIGTWEIPSQKTKNRQAHTIFLAPLAKQLLESLKPLTGQSIYVFDTGLNSHGHIHTDALTRSLRRLIKPEKPTNKKSNTKKQKLLSTPPLADMKYFTVHDIRRSAATAMGENLKVKPHVIERMLNHQPLNKLVRTYQRAMYIDEQKEAWLKWGDVIEHQIATNQAK